MPNGISSKSQNASDWKLTVLSIHYILENRNSNGVMNVNKYAPTIVNNNVTIILVLVDSPLFGIRCWFV